jgi:hypothetical protein
MSRSTVDSGALNLAIDILKRNAERHGQPSMLEAAELLQKSAAVTTAMSCENCKHGRFRSIDDNGVCHLIDGNFSNVKLPLVRQVDDNFTFTVPRDFHCKLWEPKDVGQTKAP